MSSLDTLFSSRTARRMWSTCWLCRIVKSQARRSVPGSRVGLCHINERSGGAAGQFLQNFACVTQHFLDGLLVGFALPIIGRQHTSIAVDFGTENVKISRRVRNRLCPYCKLECLSGALLF